MRYSLCPQRFCDRMAKIGINSSFCTDCVNFFYLKFIGNCLLSLGKRPRSLKVVDELFWSGPCLPLQLHLIPFPSTPCSRAAFSGCLQCPLGGLCPYCAMGLELLYSRHSSPLLCLPLLLINSKVTSPERPSQAF